MSDFVKAEDVLAFGEFDGTHDSLEELVTACTYITPLTWVVKHDDDKSIKSVLFFDREKTAMMEEGLLPKKKNARFVIKKGDKWATFYEHLEDNEIRAGITKIGDEEMADIIKFKLSEDKFIDQLAEEMGAFVLRFDDDGVPIVPDELKDDIDPQFLKYLLEAHGITAE